jgi:biopolymer transport protein ExbD
MLKTTKKILPPSKINLTPMLDTVFIFIFFLIFSSKFVHVFEINTETPLVREVPHSERLDTPPLNLIINISKDLIVITTGPDRQILETINRVDTDADIKLKDILMILRKKYPDDDYAIISPSNNILYEEIVKYIDVIQKLPDGVKGLALPNSKKNKFVFKIYGQIVLEPLKDET